MCVCVLVAANPPGDHQCVSVRENNKFEEGGEMRGCDHQSIPLLFLKLRGRDECEGRKERERERERLGSLERVGPESISVWTGWR